MLPLLHEIELVSVSQQSTNPPLLTVNNTHIHADTHAHMLKLHKACLCKGNIGFKGGTQWWDRCVCAFQISML